MGVLINFDCLHKFFNHGCLHKFLIGNLGVFEVLRFVDEDLARIMQTPEQCVFCAALYFLI